MTGPTSESIALDLTDYLRKNPDVCADVSLHAGKHPWVRYNGKWQYVEYGENRRVIGRIYDLDIVVEMFAGNPVTLEPCSEAYRWRQAAETVWEDADEQDVFTDLDRCDWCGHSERTRDLSTYKSVNDGDVTLCKPCSHSWADADELVSPDLEASA